MDYEETMVDEIDDVEADDTLPEDVVEEQDESEESLESLTEEEDEGQPEEEKPEKESKGASEPGWIKQRVDKAVSKALEQERAKIRSEYENQFAPIRERLMEMDAQELMRTGKVKDIETARELVRYRQGQPQTAPAADSKTQPRQANGQFAPKEDPGVKARISMLRHQADVILEKRGINVTEEFMNNETIKQKVVRGEMDFYDVADMLAGQKKSRKAPAPMRSPNGASGTNPNAIDTMSDEQFDRMEKRIKEGARYSLRK